MGKSRRNRAKAGRSDPISRPVKLPSDPELVALRESKVLPVLKDLRSPDPKLRTSAAGAVANIVQDAKCRKLLLREQVVHTLLVETLTDSSIESRAAGWEILKVLAQEEDSDFCVHLFRMDIVTAIDHASGMVLETLTSQDPAFSKLSKAQQRFVWDIVGSLVSLLSALASARDEILEAVVRNASIIRFLFTLITCTLCPRDKLEDALSCLMTLSEDSLELAQAITGDQSCRCYETLLKLKSGDDLGAVLACGVLHNIFSVLQWQDHSPGKDGMTDAVLISALSRVLEQTNLNVGATCDAEPDSAGTIQLCLEILASIGTDLQGSLERGDREEAEWNGLGDDQAMEEDRDAHDSELEESGEDEGEMDRDDADEDMDVVTGADGATQVATGLQDLPTLKELVQKAVPQLVRLADIPTAIDEALTVRTHALSALNNVAWSLSCFDFSDSQNGSVFQLWAPAARNIWSKVITPILSADTEDVNLATLVTSLAWALSRSLQGSTPVSGDEYRRFMTLYQASKGLTQESKTVADPATYDPFQGLGVKCVGVLGQLARDPAPLPLNREVGVFLMTVLGSLPETPAADAVEALNQIFDIYGDESHPCDKEVFWRDSFLKHLEDIAPKFKSMVKSIDKRTVAELRARADEASLNLTRFLQYKRKHMP